MDVADKLPKAVTLDFSFVENIISKKNTLCRRETAQGAEGTKCPRFQGQARGIEKPIPE